MQDQLIKILTNLGLNTKEAGIYLACIEKGTSAVSELAQSAKINRVTTYDILEKLKSKGLVSFFTKKKIKYFSATDPEIVLDEYEKRTNDFRQFLPKFKQLTGETSHPRVRYFEGLEGIKTIYADTLTSKTEILNYANTEEIRKNWPNYDSEYVAKRAKKQIFLKGIAPHDKAGEILKKEDEKYYRNIKLVPANEFDFTNEINIYDDKVAIISFKDELIGMIIESHEIANSQRTIFNMCWKFADLFNKREKQNIKTKMLEPLSETEIKPPEISEASKEPLKSNLSLF